MAVYAGTRAVSLALAWFLLPRGRFAARHWSVSQWITTGDWGHYQAIAEHGYTFHPGHLALDASFAWYPGYPGAVDAIAWLPGVGTDRAAFVVTIVAGLAAAWGLATLGMKLTANSRVSVLFVAFWAAAPGSLVLSMLYSEALFCALAAWTLVALMDRRWLTAGLLCAAAGTVHSTGMALVVAIAMAALGTFIADRRIRWRPLAAALIAPLGLLGYWGYVAWASGRLDGWFWIERQTCHIYFDAGRGTLRLAWSAIMNGPTAPVALILLLLAAAIALIGWSQTVPVQLASLAKASPGREGPAPKPGGVIPPDPPRDPPRPGDPPSSLPLAAGRLPAVLNAYTIAIVVIAIGVSANWVGAKPRLLLPAVLLGLPLARLLAPLRTWLLWPLVAMIAAASTWFGLYLLVIARWAP